MNFYLYAMDRFNRIERQVAVNRVLQWVILVICVASLVERLAR